MNIMITPTPVLQTTRLLFKLAGKVGLEPTTLALTVRCSAIELYAKKSGRGDRIRTYDLLVPNQTLYQAKLHPEKWWEHRDSNPEPIA